MHRPISRAAVAIAAAALLCGVAAGPRVEAHGDATGIVKERMDLMKTLGSELKGLARMFKGELPYDPEVVKTSATKIAEHAGTSLVKLFPQGSTGGSSDASEEIWKHWADFEAKADELGTAAIALAAAADGGVDGAKAAFGAIAGTCKACHHDFKTE